MLTDGACSGLTLRLSKGQVNLLFPQAVYLRISFMKTLIIRPAALGDTLMLAPAISNSREWGEVIVAGRKPGIDFLRPLVSGCLDFEVPGWHALFMDVLEPGVRLPVHEADRIVAFLNDPQGMIKKNLEHFFPGASIAVLPGYPGENEAVHVALYLAGALENSGLPVNAEKVMMEAMNSPLLLPGHRSRLRVVFHPGSGGTQKNFPPEFWLNLVRAFRKKIAFVKELPVILLGPAEENLLPLFSGEKEVEILFSPDIGKLSLLLQEASLYIGHDSGITHLSAMFGAPTLALFRHSSVTQWRPLGPRVKVVESSASGPELLEETLKAAHGFLNANARL
jgi:ADP-heptose:LPS heptosyltransferase